MPVSFNFCIGVKIVACRCRGSNTSPLDQNVTTKSFSVYFISFRSTLKTFLLMGSYISDKCANAISNLYRHLRLSFSVVQNLFLKRNFLPISSRMTI